MKSFGRVSTGAVFATTQVANATYTVLIEPPSRDSLAPVIGVGQIEGRDRKTRAAAVGALAFSTVTVTVRIVAGSRARAAVR